MRSSQKKVLQFFKLTCFCVVLGGPPDHPRSNNLPRKLTGLSTATPLGVSYYTEMEGVQGRVSKGQRHVGQSPGETGKLPRVPSARGQPGCAPSVRQRVVLSPRVVVFCSWGWPCGTLCLTRATCRPPSRKQVSAMTCVACAAQVPGASLTCSKPGLQTRVRSQPRKRPS